MRVDRNAKEGPLSHWKMKCLFLDYVQLLMIGWPIWATNVDWNAKKKQKRPLKSSKNMLVFGLCSTSDDRSSDLSDEHQPKCKKIEKRPPKSLKNEMFIFALHSTSDDWPSNLSDKRWPKCRKTKKDPLSHQKIKCSFLDYIQLLMIGQAIRVMNVDQNTKQWTKAP